MIHPYTRYGMLDVFDPTEWSHGCYELTENISWCDCTQTISVISKAGVPLEFQILEGSFWSNDTFKKGEEVFLFVKRKKNPNKNITNVCLIVSKEFFEKFYDNSTILEAVYKLKNLMKLTDVAQKMACTFMENGFRSDDNEHFIPNFITPSNQDEYYSIIEPCLLLEQRHAFKRWKEPNAYMKQHGKEKINYLLSISPTSPLYGTYEITYKSIMEVFNKQIVGHDNLKHSLAKILSEKQKSKKRRICILLYGLPGTGKTYIGRIIAEALHHYCRVISLGNITSTTSLVGCESLYDNSEPGIPLKTFKATGTSEETILWDEVDKLAAGGSERGKDGTVIETLLSILDPERPYLCDNYMDNTPIDCSNLCSILTANRIDNLPEELLNRCDLVYEMKPYSEAELLEILKRRMPELETEYELPHGWVKPTTLKEMCTYRSDFGARDVTGHLKTLASISKNTKKTVTASMMRPELAKIVNLNDPAVRYHRNEKHYPDSQKKLILDLFSQRASTANLTTDEKHKLDMRINYLTKLIPEEKHTFDVDLLLKETEKELYGMKKVSEHIASELYAATIGQTHPVAYLLEGPAGVGKSTIVEAIAKACHRKYIRLQMNGTNDSLFIHGLSKEYHNADAGKPVQKMAQAETTSPLLYFDEIEKVSYECAMSMLDIFDDSRKLYDHFLDTTIDISGALLIASCNDLSKMDPVLLSRFKVIHIAGYTAKEKKEIARQYLLPSIIGNQKITLEQDALDLLLKHYENDAGIRSVKHELQTLIHQCMLQQRDKNSVIIKADDVADSLKEPEYVYLADKHPGCVNGLGTLGNSKGTVMPIRVTLLQTNTKRVTGLPEDSIRDSILIAETWLEEVYGITLTGYHVHFMPAGIKKDGPSAGVSIALALLSAKTQTVLPDVAFTGDFDGKNIHPVGGLELKVQCAQSTGLHTVYLPAKCKNKIDTTKFDINIKFVDKIEEIVTELFPCLSSEKRKVLS